MIEFRSQLPFGDDVLAEVRKNVMARVTRPRPWLAAWSLAATAAAIAVIVMLVIPRGEDFPVTVPGGLRARPTFTLRRTGSQPVPMNVRAVPKRKPHHRQPAIAEVPVRIELQTSDPDVRIIWISDRRNHEESGNDVVRPTAGDDRGSR